MGEVTRSVKWADLQVKLEIDLARHRVRVQMSQPRKAILLAVGEAGCGPA